MPTGNKSGSIQQIVNCAGISGNNSLGLSGSSAPSFGISAPAAIVGTIGTNGSSSCTLTLTDPNQTVVASSGGVGLLAVFWLAGGILQACYDLVVASVSFSTPTTTATITQSTSIPTTGKFWAASGSAPTALPGNGTQISVAVNQDIADGVSINSGTGANIQQLIATSTQPGLIEWCNNASNSPTSQRLSAILTAQAFDTWPTQSSQSGSLPSGAGNWSANATVANIRCYNLGSTPANVGTSSQSANMQAGLLLT